MEGPEVSPLANALASLVAKRELTPEQVRQVMQAMMNGQADEAETAALLTAWRLRGETGSELAAAAAVLREQMEHFETGCDQVLDTCGTGGDGTGTFNISTAAALAAAGAGVRVVKHGNRAVSSRSGSADVLAALGVPLEGGPAAARACLDHAGFAFCFAPHYHPALRHVGGVRRKLRMRTLFNCLGPLANPARAAYQLLGVGRPELLDPLASALARLGVRHALLVCGQDGLDEVSLSGPTLVREIRAGRVTAREWTPRDFGLEPCALAELAAASPGESAAMIEAVFRGEDGPAARIVIANTAAALVAADRVGNVREGVARATASIRAGEARNVLTKLRATVRPTAA